MILHLVDATYELFRNYHALPSLRAPDGREVAAVRGLLGTMLALLEEHRVTHVAAATDREIRSFRNDLFAGYKTEAGVPEELLAQFPLAERALEGLGIRVFPMVRYEADDALASAAARFGPQAERVLIHTPDKDLAQCVRGERVVLSDRRRGRIMGEEGVRDRFGVGPASIPDYLALVGDSADGLPGVPGWGEKSTAALLGRYLHLEAIPIDPDRWEVEVRGAARLAEGLADHLGEALLFRYLATLREEVPVGDSVEELAWAGVPRERFLELCEELGFGGIRERPHRWA